MPITGFGLLKYYFRSKIQVKLKSVFQVVKVSVFRYDKRVKLATVILSGTMVA